MQLNDWLSKECRGLDSLNVVVGVPWNLPDLSTDKLCAKYFIAQLAILNVPEVVFTQILINFGEAEDQYGDFMMFIE